MSINVFCFLYIPQLRLPSCVGLRSLNVVTSVEGRSLQVSMYLAVNDQQYDVNYLYVYKLFRTFRPCSPKIVLHQSRERKTVARE